MGRKNPHYGWDNNLRYHRKNRAFSQEALAFAVGLSTKSVQEIEYGNLSGRNHADKFSEVLQIPAEEIFPYYHYRTFSEAAEELNVSSALVSRRVAEGAVPFKVFGRTRMVRPDELRGRVRKRARVSIRKQLTNLLRESGPLNIHDIKERLGPYESEDHRKTRYRTINSTLSRYDCFQREEVDGTSFWRYVDS